MWTFQKYKRKIIILSNKYWYHYDNDNNNSNNNDNNNNNNDNDNVNNNDNDNCNNNNNSNDNNDNNNDNDNDNNNNNNDHNNNNNNKNNILINGVQRDRDSSQIFGINGNQNAPDWSHIIQYSKECKLKDRKSTRLNSSHRR